MPWWAKYTPTVRPYEMDAVNEKPEGNCALDFMKESQDV